jgi:hypothetical protein
MSDQIKARWVAGFRAVLPDGTELIPGVTEVRIGAGEAAESDHWEPVVAAKPSKTEKEG